MSCNMLILSNMPIIYCFSNVIYYYYIIDTLAYYILLSYYLENVIYFVWTDMD